MIVDKINQYLSSEGKKLDETLLEDVGKLAKYAFVKQFGIKEEKKPDIWFSSIGGCLRQQAYGLLGFEPNGKEIDSRAKMVFIMGDLVELVVLNLAKAAGCQIEGTGLNQERALFEGMSGRPDGVLVLPEARILVEVKSMASYTFERFEGGQIEDKYVYQCNAGMAALGLAKTCIVALNKDSGVLAEQVIDRDLNVIGDISQRIKTLRAVTYETFPERPYHPDAKGFYPWQCRYCSFFKTCLPNSELVLIRDSYKLKEKS